MGQRRQTKYRPRHCRPPCGKARLPGLPGLLQRPETAQALPPVEQHHDNGLARGGNGSEQFQLASQANQACCGWHLRRSNPAARPTPGSRRPPFAPGRRHWRFIAGGRMLSDLGKVANVKTRPPSLNDRATPARRAVGCRNPIFSAGRRRERNSVHSMGTGMPGPDHLLGVIAQRPDERDALHVFERGSTA